VTEFAPNGGVIGSFRVGAAPLGIAPNGTHIWVTNSGDNTVDELNPDGSVRGLGAIPVGHFPHGIASDGTHVWVTNSDDNSVTELTIT
jgi:DNA-binding beta-propeller fold protein YncE